MKHGTQDAVTRGMSALNTSKHPVDETNNCLSDTGLVPERAHAFDLRHRVRHNTERLTRCKLQLSGGETAFTVRGPLSAPNVVLVFGGLHFPRNCDAFFDDLAREVGSNAAIITFDYYGRGDSAAPDLAYDEDTYLDQASELLDGLNLAGRKIVALGYSFGGAVATRFAGRFPNRVSALILSGAWMTWEPLSVIARLFAAPVLRSIPASMWWKATEREIIAGFRNQVIAKPYVDHMLSVEKKIASSNPEGFRRAIFNTLYNFPRDAKEALVSLASKNIETFLVWGDQDRISPVSNALHIRELLHNSHLAVLTGGHNDMWVVPSMSARLVDTFARFLTSDLHMLEETPVARDSAAA